MPEPVSLRKEHVAVIDVRLLPWRPRQRRLDPALVREHAGSVTDLADDLTSLLLTVGVWIAIVVAAPLLVVLLALALLPVELLVVVIIGVAILVVRLAGIVPWTVRITDRNGAATSESYRSLPGAIRRVRTVNTDRRIPVTFRWT